MRGWENIFHANGKQKKPGVSILTSDKIDLKTVNKKQRRILHNDQGINSRRRHNPCKYLNTQHRSISVHKQTLTDIKEEIDSNTVIVGDLNTPLTAMDRTSKQKINKETQTLNEILEH